MKLGIIAALLWSVCGCAARAPKDLTAQPSDNTSYGLELPSSKVKGMDCERVDAWNPDCLQVNLLTMPVELRPKDAEGSSSTN